MSSFLLFLLIFSISTTMAQARVPPSHTFKYINQGQFSYFEPNYRPLPIFKNNFRLAFQNSIPNAYILALGLGSTLEEANFKHWVWEANRGDPVRDNATLTFAIDGNLVLADVDGRIVWSTHTTNMNVTGLQLLENGNMILHDNDGRWVWQSFDHPTDTIVEGQSLRSHSGPSMLVSRVSHYNGKPGIYSLFFNRNRLALFTQVPKLVSYYTFPESMIHPNRSLPTMVTLKCVPIAIREDPPPCELRLVYSSDSNEIIGYTRLARINQTSPISILKLESDGNLRAYTFSDYDWNMWQCVFKLFGWNGTSDCWY